MSLDIVLAVVGAVLSVVLGAVGLGRAPRHASQPWFAIGLVLLAGEVALGGAVGSATSMAAVRLSTLAQLAISAFVVAAWFRFSVLYSRSEPTARVSRLSNYVIGAAVVLGVAVLVVPDFGITPISETGDAGPHVGRLGSAVEVFGLLGAIAILTNLERTFRHAVGVMRWRIKYLVLGVSVLFVFRLFLASQALLYGAVDPHLQRISAVVLIVSCLLMAVAMRRTSAFAVDVYPSHALLFRSLTIVLAGIYLLVVGLLARVVTLLGGAEALPLKALFVLLALTGLAVILMSDRLRQQLRRAVSRHLRRPAYDYQRVWTTFTARTTSLVEEPVFCRAVVDWVSETFQVLSASIWVLDEGADRMRFGASTSLTDTAAHELEDTQPELRGILPQLANHRQVINLDKASPDWVEPLRRFQPGVFAHGGDRLCLALKAGGQLLGVLMIGDRVSGLELSEEDLELLQCVGDQTAAGLLNQQLSRRLVGAKEMEAFQTMSAFFVHDLKNTASSLSLMFQNLEEHFADPEFRADAIRAVGKSVQHLNDLIGRLGLLRQELTIHAVPCDLATVVEGALADTGRPANVTLLKGLNPVPDVPLDPNQIRKVVQNLVLNAQDAVGADGQVEVATQRTNGWAVLQVADNGCGMSPDFVRRSLFRPFQTSKKRGLGIGMFQSKMIVEAHRGRMEVESAPGVGTTVRVLLPLVQPV